MTVILNNFKLDTTNGIKNSNLIGDATTPNYTERKFHQETTSDNIRNSEELRNDSINYFKAVINSPGSDLPTTMGELFTQFTPEEFSNVCNSFIKGVEYIRDTLGTQPSMICITDEINTPCYTNWDTCSIAIPRPFIESLLKKQWHRQHKTEPFALSISDTAMMYGVEEAFHVYQSVTDRERTGRLMGEQRLEQNSILPKAYDAHDKQPLEAEAMKVVQQAMKDLGVIERASIAVNLDTPHNATWLDEEFLLARTKVPNHTVHVDGAIQYRLIDISSKREVI